MSIRKIITLKEVKENKTITEYIKTADNFLQSIKFTKHGDIHANVVARHAKNILMKLEFSETEGELAAIAGYMHDIGNLINRYNHEFIGAMLSLQILEKMDMELDDRITVSQAIGNHDEKTGTPCSNVAAAVIIADKCDVHRSRVRNTLSIQEDIHDRVNYAVKKANLRIFKKKKKIQLSLLVDTKIAEVMEYFEIFLSRMVICKKAAVYLGCNFELVINGSKLV